MKYKLSYMERFVLLLMKLLQQKQIFLYRLHQSILFLYTVLFNSFEHFLITVLKVKKSVFMIVFLHVAGICFSDVIRFGIIQCVQFFYCENNKSATELVCNLRSIVFNSLLLKNNSISFINKYSSISITDTQVAYSKPASKHL